MHKLKVLLFVACILHVLGGVALVAADRDHWAFVPPLRPQVPRVDNRSWCKNPIDAFVVAQLAKNGLHPADEADRGALLRRITIDLTGLPPTPGELAEFLADSSPQAYERLL